MTIERLLDKQYSLEREFRGFISSLDGDRTTTLRKLIDKPKESLEKINALWFDTDLMYKRMVSLAEFFDRIPVEGNVRGYEGLPLIFLQGTTKDEDQKEFDYLSEDKFFRDISEVRFGNSPPQIRYLHIDTNFFPRLVNSWSSRKRVVRPLMNFSSRGQLGVDQNGVGWRDKPMIVGFRIPNYAELLGVSKKTATDYLTRILVHDIGHGFLPSVSNKYEPLHNIALIYAMNVKKTNIENPWENLVNLEATDPFFFLEAEKYLSKLEEPLSDLRKVVVGEYRKWYASKKSIHRRDFLWGIKEGMSLEESKERVVKTIQDLIVDSFSRYE